MHTFTEHKHPYEFLVRWDKDGKLSGSHVGFRTVTKKDGVEIADTVETVMPVADGLRDGFPLADILALVQSGLDDKGAAFLATVAKCEADEAASKTATTKANAAAGILEVANARLKTAQPVI